MGSIIFRPHLLESPTPSPTSSAKKAQLPSQNSTTSATLATPATPNAPSIPPRIALIGAAAFALVSKQPGVQSFRIHLSDPLFSTKSASVSDETPDLSNVPEEYHEFADVFSKAKADTLAPHHPYDLKINLEEGASPPINPMYSLSVQTHHTAGVQTSLDQFHLSHQLPSQSSSPLHLEEGWISLTLC